MERPILDTGVSAGSLAVMRNARKVTVEVPIELLRKAQKSSGEGVTATLRKGLELVAASRAQEGLRRLRGRVKLSIDLRALRADRK